MPSASVAIAVQVKHGVTAEATQRIAQVEQQILDQWQRTPLTISLTHLFRSAQPDQRLSPRLFRTHALSNSIIYVHGQVAFQFGGELIVPLSEIDITANSHPQRSESAH